MKAVAPFMFALAAVAAMPAAAQTAPPAPMPPPVMTVAPPPTIRPMPMPMRAPLPPARFQVEVLGGAERLWSGSLRLGSSYSQASFNSSVNEAPESCPADKSRLGEYAPNFTRSVRIGISRRGYGDDAGKFGISASWTRPGVACEEGGSATVSFDRTFSADLGESAELRGDGGLVVRVTRIR